MPDPRGHYDRTSRNGGRVMPDDLLNGRPAADFELAAIGHARQCERDRDLQRACWPSTRGSRGRGT